MNQPTSRNRTSRLLLGIILVLALLMRCYNVTAISIWSDEAFSVALIHYPLSEMLARLVRDVHPPLYYLLLSGWTHGFGYSVASLRGLSLIFGVAAVWAGYAFVREAFERADLALGAALLLALNPFQIEYAFEARMYTLGGFLILLLAWLMVRALKRQTALSWFWVAVATSAAWYTHYYLLFSTFAIAIYGLLALWRRFGSKLQEYRYFAGCYALVLLLYVPWVKPLLFQFSQVQEDYWIPPISRWSVPLTNYLLLTGRFRNPQSHIAQIPVVLAALFSVWLMWRVSRRYRNFARWLVLLAVLIPSSMAIAASFRQSVYSNRYFFFTSLFYTVALALFVFSFKSRYLRMAWLGLGALVSVLNLVRFWGDLDIQNHQGIAYVSRYLNGHATPGDAILLATTFQFLNFEYYNRTGIRPLLAIGNPPFRRLTQMPHYAGTAAFTDDDLLPNSQVPLRAGGRIWLIWSQDFNESKPYIPANWKRNPSESFVAEDVRPHLHTQIHLDEYTIQ